jgi:hypothetical protein
VSFLFLSLLSFFSLMTLTSVTRRNGIPTSPTTPPTYPTEPEPFKPFESFWDRWFSSKSNSNSTGDKDMLFPDDALSKSNHLIRPGFPRGDFSSSSKGSPRFSSTSKNSRSGAFSATTTVVGDEDGNEVKSKDPLDDELSSLAYNQASSPRSIRSPPAFLKNRGRRRI